MKVGLFDFQEDALNDLHMKLSMARSVASIDHPQSISFSAPTGSGKTIVMTALFEDILFGEPDFPAQSDAIILWISNMPELNQQTRLKIEGMSDRIRVRQLVTIESTFDSERLKGGHIYFVNTQKLGSDKLLTQKGGDKRQYTIWETFTNTAKAIPDRFYVVIDEAHRGMQGRRAVERAKTILQRFILGSEEDGLCRMPLVIGISATPRRFEDLLANTTHTVHKIYVPTDDVRDSGLLKDRILIHYPESEVEAEMTLLAEATNRWKSLKERWTTYCEREQESKVYPILVVQVEDGTVGLLTKSDLSMILSTIENVFGRRLRDNEIAHTFHECGELPVGGHRLRHIDASRIQEDRNANIVLFKMSLSTGWDCPRAEVMMSFRRAADHTYIAQLLGRMVRTPLARRVEIDAALNDVHLFLPNYDKEAVETVIEDLKNVEDVPPSEAGTVKELVTLHRREGTSKIFDELNKLVTYRVNAVRKQSGLRRLMGLGRNLTQDGIDNDAWNSAKDFICECMDRETQRLKDTGSFDEKAKHITDVNLRKIVLQHINGSTTDNGDYIIDAVSEDIDRYFQQSGRVYGNGLHMTYWKAHGNRDADSVKLEAIILSQDNDGMRSLETHAESKFDQLFEQYKREIGHLREQRRKQYEKLRLATSRPQNIYWRLPEVIDFKRKKDAQKFDKHLYVEDDGLFRADLGPWEREVLEEEMQDNKFVAWLRNLDRKSWSLEIPYEIGGAYRPMFPDLLIVRQDSNGFIFDILEPHDHSRKDNHPKAVGLAKFAEEHYYLFDRIQLIRKMRGPSGDESYRRLDVGNQAVRRKVLRCTSNDQLDQIFEEEAN